MQNVTESEYKFTIYEKVVVPPFEWNAEMLCYLVRHFQVLHFQITYVSVPLYIFLVVSPGFDLVFLSTSQEIGWEEHL